MSASPVVRQLILTSLVAATGSAGCGRFQRLKGNEKVSADGTSLLVLGDSLSTGIFTSPRFSLDYGNIISQAVKGEKANPTGIISPTKDQPVRIRKPSEEIHQLGKGDDLAAEALMKVIEWPELSWGNIVGGTMETPPAHVVIAARNGAQTDRAADEVGSWIGDTKEGKKPRLPAEAYFFFSGDDLCRERDAQDTMTPPDKYVAGIRDGVHKLAQGGEVNPAGTTVYLVSHLDILQQVTNPDILANKRIHISDPSDHEISCLDFAKKYQNGQSSARPEDKVKLFTYNPMNICYNMLAHATGLDPAQAKVPLPTLQATIDGYRSGLAALATELQADPSVSGANIQVKLITTTNDLKMVPDDLANDCFHLSEQGQDKLAKAIEAGKK